MKNLIFLLAYIISFGTYAQISFEKGYFIDIQTQKINCYIKNIDWKNNPTEFQYKLTLDDEVKIAKVTNIQEFVIEGVAKYISKNVDIDRSSEYTKRLSNIRAPEFKKEHLFLKVLVEGTASLYMYEDGMLKRYFYSTSMDNVKQLVFKSYLKSGNKIGVNNQFRQQLWTELKCDKISIEEVNDLTYTKSDLIVFFKHYNSCKSQHYVNYQKVKKRDFFQLSIRPGLNSSKLSAKNDVIKSRDVVFDKEVGFRLGVEAEMVLPFNKNKWSVFIEPTYQYFKSEKKIPSHTVTANYKSIEVPFGVRYYMYLNNDSRLFINGVFVYDFSINSKIKSSNGIDLNISKSANSAFGVGYKHKNYSLELRYQNKRGLLNKYISWSSNFNVISFILGYSLF